MSWRAVLCGETRAEHGGRATPGRPSGAVGYALLGSGRVFFAGDTDLFDAMEGLVPDLDVALLPIWGWGPRLPAGHLNPESAARATALIKPAVVIPVHWGTLRSVGTRVQRVTEAPALAFAAAVAKHAAASEVRILSPGESMPLDP